MQPGTRYSPCRSQILIVMLDDVATAAVGLVPLHVEAHARFSEYMLRSGAVKVTADTTTGDIPVLATSRMWIGDGVLHRVELFVPAARNVTDTDEFIQGDHLLELVAPDIPVPPEWERLARERLALLMLFPANDRQGSADHSNQTLREDTVVAGWFARTHQAET